MHNIQYNRVMQSVHRLIDWFIPDHYELTLDINRKERTFYGTVTIAGTTTQENVLRLHAKDLVITDAVIDGKTASFSSHENDELELTQDALQPGTHIIVLGFDGKLTDSMHGMYPCYFQHEGRKKELVATQFESHHAREVFPCVDEPEAKATFDVTLLTEQNVTVLGNMPIDHQKTEDDKLVTTFDTTPRMSSYLLAWVYGELHKKSAETKDGVEVNIWATVAQPSESLDFALDIAVRATEFFNEYFDTPYPLPKADHVALPDFSSGAMENWGLITYRESALLAHPRETSVSSKRMIATVITHELSHQWFGNLVTMKWWNNLWLNESFANLMEYIAVNALHPEWNIWLDYAGHEVILALRRDAIDGVQSVQVDVHHPDEISTLFDGAIVYAKGGRLLRMLQHYIGHEQFQAGLKQYFKKYAYQNTEGDDLWEELSKTSGKDITTFMNTWISQPGYPVVSVTTDSISQEQFFVGKHDESAKRLWPVPLNASSESTPKLLETSNFSTGLSLGERLNVGDTAHFITLYSDEHFEAIRKQLVEKTLLPIDRLQFLHEQTMLTRGGQIESARLIPLLNTYKQETADGVWDIIGLTLGELKKFVDADSEPEAKLRQLSASIATNEFHRLGWEKHTAEPDTDTKLRSTIAGMMVYGRDEAVLEQAKEIFKTNTLENIEPEIRGLVIGTMVRHFHEKQLIDDLIAHYSSASSVDVKLDICDGLTSTNNTETIKKLLSLLLDTDTVRTQDTARWFVYLMRNRDARELTWQWMKDNWPWIEEKFAGDKSFDDYPRYAAMGLSTREQLSDYISFFTPFMDIPALKRAIQLGISEIEGRVELIERDQAGVHQALLNL